MYVHFSVYTYCYFQQAPKEKRKKKILVGAVMIAGYGTHDVEALLPNDVGGSE